MKPVGGRRRRGMASSSLVLACGAAALLWLTLTLLVLVGRVAHDLAHRRPRRRPWSTDLRLARRARRHWTELGRGRRGSALVELARRASPHAQEPLFAASLSDRDTEVREAGVRALGVLADRLPWARRLLVDTLRSGAVSRSRVAAQLEGVPELGGLLSPLLHDDQAPVRYWAAMLLGPQSGAADGQLAALVDDADAGVRRAAIESLAERGERAALPRILARLDDDVMFVRAHACRAAATLGGSAAAPALIHLLGDEVWWVRTAAKDTLRGLGRAVVPLVVGVLDADDRFARNGAAEVLQDLGLVDDLLRTQPDAPLLERIFAAGEEGLEAAARRRVGVEAGPAEDATPVTASVAASLEAA